MAEQLILHAVAFVAGLCLGRWLFHRQEARRSVNLYDPPANSASTAADTFPRKDQRL